MQVCEHLQSGKLSSVGLGESAEASDALSGMRPGTSLGSALSISSSDTSGVPIGYGVGGRTRLKNATA